MFSVNEPVEIYSVFPVVMFKNQKNVEIFVHAFPIPDNSVLACVVHEFDILGVKIEDGGNTYVKCVVPSYEAIVNSASATNPVPSSGEVEILIKTDNQIFTEEGVTFKFLDTNQVNDITPLNGPDTGGTIIRIELDIDQTEGDIGDVYCIFWNTETIVAVGLPPYHFHCTTPELDTSI